MTHNSSTFTGPKIALFEPDIPQNTAAIIRTCACLGVELEIIEPCGFLLNDKRFKRVVMDYMDNKMIRFYQSFDRFYQNKENHRIVLMTTKAPISYTKFKFEKSLDGDRLWKGYQSRYSQSSNAGGIYIWIVCMLE